MLTTIFMVTRNSTVTIETTVTVAKVKTSNHTNIGNCIFTLLQYLSVNTTNIITLLRHVSTCDSQHQADLRTV